jgi:addiction module RelE/StbE family toxin
MRVQWTSKALSDLVRLKDFLTPVNVQAAESVTRVLARAPRKLLERPRVGTRLEQFEGQEIRRIIIGDYEMRYEILGDVIYIVRLWHSREDR